MPPIVPGNPEQPEAPVAWMPPPRPRRQSWVEPVIVALAALVVVLGAAAVWFAVRPRPAAPVAASVTAPATSSGYKGVDVDHRHGVWTVRRSSTTKPA
jgi:hypothetical protein